MSLEKPRHWPDCRCVLCLKFQATCEECGREFRTYPSFRSHQSSHDRARKKKNLALRPQNKKIIGRRMVVIPDGLGYLQATLATKDGLAGYNLAAMSRFAAALNASRKSPRRFTKGHKLVLSRLVKDPTVGFSKVDCELQQDQAISIYQLALAVNAYPGDVISLLVSYGLEHLARELRATGQAPTTTDPSKRTEPVVREVLKPRTPHEEFVATNFPEVAPPQKVIESVEYRNTKPKTQVPRAFPSSSDEDEGQI